MTTNELAGLDHMLIHLRDDLIDALLERLAKEQHEFVTHLVFTRIEGARERLRK